VISLRIPVLAAAAAAWGLLGLNAFVVAMGAILAGSGPFPLDWQILVLFTSATVVLLFRKEIATTEGGAAVLSSIKIVSIHVAIYLIVLAAYTTLASGGFLADNALSLLFYGFFYALLMSPVLFVLGVLSQFAMKPLARWAGGKGA
jgi:hypothetical protein